jgi:phosphoglycerate dehydrogenase-like enzyme
MITVALEVDPPLRLAGVILDPDTTAERRAAVADFVCHDLPDFDGWCTALRARLPLLYPARILPVHDPATLRAALAVSDIAIVEALPVGADDLAAAPRLRCIQKFGTLTAGIDHAACAARGVTLRTQRRRTNIAVAEHAITLLLALSKRLDHTAGRVSDRRLIEGGFHPAPFDTRHTAGANWGRVSGLRTLYGATFGLLGFGEIGREMARLGRGLGMRVLVAQRTRLDPAEQTEWGIEQVPVNQLLEGSDAVSIHLPGTTRDFIGATELKQMRPGALLINTARAAIVNREALIVALTTGHLGGAGFDVMYQEPTAPDDPILQIPNLLLTPHLAGGTRWNALADMEEMLQGLEATLPC